MRYRIGKLVIATKEIIEFNFNGKAKWTHAVPGDSGEIIHVSENGTPTVLFSKSQTSTVVAPSEIAEG